ncbi:Adaptin-N domain-containing protein [Salix suchowensis]|nr:Adaptin-N domain-containing protein [Salix suchowensis]
MHALKHPSFFKPTSRPSSPAPAPPSRPDSGIGFDRTPRPLHKLSLSTFRKASPAPVAPKSPTKPPSTLVQDGSYLEMLSLKLSEAVSKALAQPLGPAVPMELVGGKRPIPAGRGRALGALITSIKNDLGAVIDGLEFPQTPIKTIAKPSVSHPSLVALQGVVPAYTRILERCISLPGSQTTVATFLISLIWRGLVALSHRPYHPPSPPASPYLAAHDVKKRRGSSTTPPLTPPSSRFTIKLPPSRPPSPPSRITSSTSTDARALYEILSHLPRPAADKEASRLAREAVEEAFTALHAFDPFIEAVYASTVSPMSTVVAERLVTLAKELPTLIVLQVILNAYGSPLGTSLPQILRLDTAEYKQVCLSGFGRAEECGPVWGSMRLTPFAPLILQALR